MGPLYHELLLDLYRHPLNKKALPTYSEHHQANNPLCGDEIELFVSYDKNETVTEVGWQGEGCAISQAAASLFTEEIKGVKKSEITAFTPEKITSLLGLTNLNPTRLRCATLCLEAFKKEPLI